MSERVPNAKFVLQEKKWIYMGITYNLVIWSTELQGVVNAFISERDDRQFAETECYRLNTGNGWAPTEPLKGAFAD